ncbi:uncharacterized protein LOC106076631 isoform X2 [Biomphalaria glabrata]|uniref:Uncharacterized protein LOC106076631 isoform X2 n=1 Tax=Biomphalaria glabrata TaxID=6526 RepID=A0A9W2ZEV5_BIOGL|nr:uncharacterized protein LOC106076631 isoform X2 [Biomphalaria glabrata]XP_055873421.1 uncharacterized protein LOC106076631 isoform X2 [Biomphalaria glabrata]XP_055873422.1 uncharacterized protein LOC106076631 isoform X2 [Biomphalaria glabrata]
MSRLCLVTLALLITLDLALAEDNNTVVPGSVTVDSITVAGANSSIGENVNIKTTKVTTLPPTTVMVTHATHSTSAETTSTTEVLPIYSIVNKRKVGEGDSFSIECDITKFNKKDFTIFPDIYSMAVERKTLGSDNYKSIVRYIPSHPTRKKKINKPGPSQWDIQYLGADEKGRKAPRDTTKIIINVREASYRDAGWYRCFYYDILYQPHYSDSVFLRPQTLPTIVSTPSFNKWDPFYVQCDVTKFPRGLSVGNVTGLIVEHQPLSEKEFKVLAKFQPFEKDAAQRRSNFLTPGRRTEVIFIGVDLEENWKSDIKDTIMIVIYFNEARVSDAGNYRCTFVINGDELIRSEPSVTDWNMRSRFFNEIKPSANSLKIKIGSPFSVLCHTPEFFEQRTRVVGLKIQRKFTVEKEYQDLAEVFPDNATLFRTKQFIPKGRDWNIFFKPPEQSDIAPEQTSRYIKVLINDVGCDDSGFYRCGVLFHCETEYEFSNITRITSPEHLYQDDITVEPDDQQVEEMASAYDEGQYVVLTCTFEGPAELQGRWTMQSEPLDERSFNITDSPAVRSYDETGCELSFYKTTLAFALHREQHGWTFSCEVHSAENRTAVQSVASYTIYLKRDYVVAAARSAGVQTTPLSLAVIITLSLAVVQIVFFRKRENYSPWHKAL